MFHKMLNLRKKLIYFLSQLFVIHRNLTLHFTHPTPQPVKPPVPSILPPTSLLSPPTLYNPPSHHLPLPSPPQFTSPSPQFTPLPQFTLPLWLGGGGGKKLEGRGDEVETWHFSKRQGINSANFSDNLQHFAKIFEFSSKNEMDYNQL